MMTTVNDGSTEWTIDEGFLASHGNVMFGVDGDRFCPDTWSGEKRIMIYSTDGSKREWTLPQNWAEVEEVQLIPLNDNGRDTKNAQTADIKDFKCSLTLEKGAAYALVPSIL